MRLRQAMIGGVVVAWVVVLALLVGLPTLAWWVGGRELWSRAGKHSEPDHYREMVRRHGLRPGEAAEVEGAVTWGRELRDPRLRAAVVDWAQSLQRAAEERAAARSPRAQRAVRLLVAGWVAVLVGTVVVQVAQRDWGRLVSLFVWPLLMSWPMALVVSGPRRAIERNSGPPATPPPS